MWFPNNAFLKCSCMGQVHAGEIGDGEFEIPFKYM